MGTPFDTQLKSSTDLRRPNQLLVDLTAIRDNVQTVRKRVGRVTLIATMKANAYGLGLIPCARVALEAGADGVAISDLNGAEQLRAAGVVGRIVLFAGATNYSAAEVRAIEDLDVTPTVWSHASLRRLATHLRQPRQVSVKVDAGMARLGVAAEHGLALVNEVLGTPTTELWALSTHYHTPSVETDLDYLRWQHNRFVRFVDQVARVATVPVVMAGSSSSLQMTDEATLTGVDPGSALFGMRAPGVITRPLSTRPAMVSLTTRLVEVSTIEAAARHRLGPVGPTVLRVGVIPIGSADGASNFLGNHVLIGGRRAAVVGDPTIEYTRVDCTHIPDPKPGDLVTIFGEQDGARLSVEDILADLSQPADTLLSLSINDTVARRYLH
ncbi:hypothetical protein BayCH28_26045 [Mycolicibacterium sp. CH28]|uniref:alanine racemase n=1 Tax=Mycolicibacterium sp. CH28 TaxID=2512237 RepID=UPI001080451F|nr:alanine racemase [Mycolicibacterium sp. CH28]TGD84244.1 hypothetical protein BayCH28_26045 [Mycolicibacterium sp. CH28]